MRIRKRWIAAGVILCAIGVAVLAGPDRLDRLADGLDAAADDVRAQRLGGVDISEARVRDGDTYYMGRLGYRLARVDTPEIGERAECERELALGLAARDRVAELFVEARRVEAFPDRGNSGQASIDEDGWPLDRFRRRLAAVSVDGRDLGQLLLEEGVAVGWPGRSNWCD